MSSTHRPAAPRSPARPLAMLAAVGTLVLAGALPSVASAQSSSTGDARYSLLPGTTRGYVGANLGRAKFDTPCVAGLACEDPDLSGKLYVGGAWSRVVGLELGYLHFGSASRAGGDTDAQGVNVSLVGNLPLTDAFNAFAKVGTTYGWTSQSALGGIVTGDEHGFGLSYGAGLGFDVTNNWSLVAEWERHRMKFATGRDDVDMWSLGVKYRF